MAPHKAESKPKMMKPAKSTEKPLTSNIKKARNKRKDYQSYSVYIYRVLRSVVQQNNFTISKRSMMIMNNFVADFMEILAAEAGRLIHHGRKSTLGMEEIRTAVKLVVPGELGTHAHAEGSKAMNLYFNSHGRSAMERK